MASHDEQPPWGKRKKPQTPEEMVAQLIKKLQDFFNESDKQPPSGNGENRTPQKTNSPFAGISKIFIIAAIIIIGQAMYGAFFKIAPSEVGIVLRLGEYTRTVEPGLHFLVPFVEELHKVDVAKVRRQAFGQENAPSLRKAGVRSREDMEALMLTADMNVISVTWIVQYRISDPLNFLFKIEDVEQAIHDLSESVTRRIVGNMDFDFVLSNRVQLANAVQKELQEQLNNLEAGVILTEVKFQGINPPDRVQPAFNEVNEAEQDKARMVNEAEEQYNRVIPAARGNAKQILEQAKGYSIERLNNAKGETVRFSNILAEYENAPQVTRQRMYLETMQDILPSVQNIYIMDENQQGPLPLLNLGKNSSTVVPSK